MDFPNGKVVPGPEDTLAATADDGGTILTVIFSDESDVYLREGGAWQPVAEGDERVDGAEWIDVTSDFVPEWDRANTASEIITSDELGEYRAAAA